MIQYDTYHLKPHECSPFVGLWSIETKDNIHVTDLIPDGFIDILIPCGGAIISEVNGEMFKQQRPVVVGQITTNSRLIMSQRARLVGIKIQPYMLDRLLADKAEMATNKLVELSDLDTSLFGFILDAIDEIRTLNSLEAIAKKSKLEDIRMVHPGHVVKQINEGILRQVGQVRIDDFATRYNCSRRYIEKLFKKHIGLTAKHYARIIRVKKASLMLSQQGHSHIADIASDLSYFDASHFYRDFKSIVQCSPKDFRSRNMENTLMNNQKYTSQWIYSQSG